MNENLNLIEILKDCPKGTKLYSPIFGEVEFDKIDIHSDHPIRVLCKYGNYSFSKDGRIFSPYDGECMLFQSKDQRDWGKFMTKQSEREELCESQEITKWAYISDSLSKQPKFDPKTLKPFDKVLVRDGNLGNWKNLFFSYIIERETCYPYFCLNNQYKYCIPYNEDTMHLVGTDNDAPDFYRYWEE